ncbi:hypothetical protein H7H51_03435 [Mycolicibacterium farcinogenes]|nr:hypothetical protein [Mycolicibacterium farcinogenes]
MSTNQLSMVRNQFKTRGYTVDEIHLSVGNLETFTVESGPSPKLAGLPVAYIPDPPRNPSGNEWVASEIHWWTDKQEYAGDAEPPAELVDRILETVEQDNRR